MLPNHTNLVSKIKRITSISPHGVLGLLSGCSLITHSTYHLITGDYDLPINLGLIVEDIVGGFLIYSGYLYTKYGIETYDEFYYDLKNDNEIKQKKINGTIPLFCGRQAILNAAYDANKYEFYRDKVDNFPQPSKFKYRELPEILIK